MLGDLGGTRRAGLPDDGKSHHLMNLPHRKQRVCRAICKTRSIRESLTEIAKTIRLIRFVTAHEIRTTLPVAISLPSQSVTGFPADSFGRARAGFRNLTGSSYVSPSWSVRSLTSNRQSKASPSTNSGHP